MYVFKMFITAVCLKFKLYKMSRDICIYISSAVNKYPTAEKKLKNILQIDFSTALVKLFVTL